MENRPRSNTITGDSLMSAEGQRNREREPAVTRNHDTDTAIMDETDPSRQTSGGKDRPAVLWFTGLPGAGKTTVANALLAKLRLHGREAALLDGDDVRGGLSKDLGFSDADRDENIRRVAETSKLIADAGMMVIVAMISPFRLEREMARDILAGATFIETFIDAPLEVCEARDPKGHYSRARRGEISQFTGIDSRYEPPEHPDLHVDAANQSIEESVDSIVRHLRASDLLRS